MHFKFIVVVLRFLKLSARIRFIQINTEKYPILQAQIKNSGFMKSSLFHRTSACLEPHACTPENDN